MSISLTVKFMSVELMLLCNKVWAVLSVFIGAIFLLVYNILSVL